MLSFCLSLQFFCIIHLLNGYVIDINSQDRKFDGIGALSAGASSRLLIDYEEPFRSQILDYLFLPNFGASLQILKVEIGGDTWSTCGTEPSHSHTKNDLNYYRGYEYWLMAEAQKRNKNIKFYGLPWGFPAWVGGGLNETTVNYIYSWVKGAKDIYNCTINWLGVWNEAHFSSSYVKLLRQKLDDNNFQNTRIVVPDEGAFFMVPTILSEMQSDSQFASSFDIIGVHYPPSWFNGTTVANLSTCGKILWSSEDSSTNDNMIGGGCWGRILNWNWIYGNYTATIMWSLISSWYEYLPYSGAGMMNAAWPWNGYYEVQSPIWITAHTTQFVDTANNDLYYIQVGHGSGILNKGGTYVTLTDGMNISIIIETMDYNHSICHNANPPDYWTVIKQNITFQLINLPKNIKLSSLYRWQSLFDDNNSYLFEKQEPVVVNSNNTFTLLNVVPNSVITLTTMSTGNKGNYTNPINKIIFPLPYSDNFDSYSSKIKNGYQPQPKYFSDQAGSFVVTNNTLNNYVLQQVVPNVPIAWHPGDNPPQPLTIIGDYNMSNVNLSVSVHIIPPNQTIYSSFPQITPWNISNIIIGLRLGGSLSNEGYVPAIGQNWFNWGYFLQINDNGYWKLMSGASSSNTILIEGNLNMDLRQIWFNISLSVNEYTLSAKFNDKLLFNQINDTSKRFSNGWAALSCGWQKCQFDNFMIK